MVGKSWRAGKPSFCGKRTLAMCLGGFQAQGRGVLPLLEELRSLVCLVYLGMESQLFRSRVTWKCSSGIGWSRSLDRPSFFVQWKSVHLCGVHVHRNEKLGGTATQFHLSNSASGSSSNFYLNLVIICLTPKDTIFLEKAQKTVAFVGLYYE